jgi:hypothetical protein
LAQELKRRQPHPLVQVQRAMIHSRLSPERRCSSRTRDASGPRASGWPRACVGDDVTASDEAHCGRLERSVALTVAPCQR